MEHRDLLHEFRCRLCRTFFLYDRHRGNDFRCDKCRKANAMTVDEVQQELEEMSDEEFQSFMDDIEEFEKECLEKRIEEIKQKRRDT